MASHSSSFCQGKKTRKTVHYSLFRHKRLSHSLQFHLLKAEIEERGAFQSVVKTTDMLQKTNFLKIVL